MEPQDVTGGALREGPEQAGTLVELTVLLVGRARRCRTQLRAIEAETGISKTTWSAWARGQRAAGRDRVAEVAGRYDPDGAQAWLDAWDRLAAPAEPDQPMPPTSSGPAVPAPRRRVPAPAGVAGVVLGVLVAGSVAGPSAGGGAVPPVPPRASAAAGPAGTAQTATALDTGRASSGASSMVVPDDPVRVVAPEPGQATSGCVEVEGTGRADAGQVLVVSVRSWRGASASFRFAPVQYGSGPGGARAWRARQRLPPTEGGDYEVLVVAVDARAARVEHDLNLATGRGWVAPELPLSARVLSAVRVRDDGTARRGCAG